MQAPPVISPNDHTRAKDFRLRSLSAIVIGTVGFWWPFWYDSRFPPEIDSRLGMVFIFTLPFILAAAVWATYDFRLAHRPRYLSATLLLLAWSPLLFVGLGIIRAVFAFAFSR
jgi:hypothetical protein